MLKLHGRFRLRLDLIYTIHEAVRGTAHEDGGYNQAIGSTVYGAIIVRSWLWSTTVSSSTLGSYSRLLQVVDNRLSGSIDCPFDGSWPLKILPFTQCKIHMHHTMRQVITLHFDVILNVNYRNTYNNLKKSKYITVHVSMQKCNKYQWVSDVKPSSRCQVMQYGDLGGMDSPNCEYK